MHRSALNRVSFVLRTLGDRAARLVTGLNILPGLDLLISVVLVV
jgi:hypothetical protein